MPDLDLIDDDIISCKVPSSSTHKVFNLLGSGNKAKIRDIIM